MALGAGAVAALAMASALGFVFRVEAVPQEGIFMRVRHQHDVAAAAAIRSEWPSAPVRLLPSPWRPRSALCSGLKRYLRRVFSCGSATSTTSPPRPPSPPLGPPCGTYFSRRKAMQPLPPSPAFTRILTSSINIENPPACFAAGGPFPL